QVHADGIGNCRRRALAGESTLANQPLADVLLVEHLLLVTAPEALGVLVGYPVAAGGGCVDLVDEENLVPRLAKLVFGVDEDQTSGAGPALPFGEQRQRELLGALPVSAVHQSFREDLSLGDRLVVLAVLGFGGWRDQRGFERLVLAKVRSERNPVC